MLARLNPADASNVPLALLLKMGLKRGPPLNSVATRVTKALDVETCPGLPYGNCTQVPLPSEVTIKAARNGWKSEALSTTEASPSLVHCGVVPDLKK